MNFLAHLALAEPTAESLIGNLAGDFVKGRVPEELPPAIQRGIVEHRRIDTFTDTHPDVAATRRVITEDHGHYSRVIGDIFLDHFLVRHFDEFMGEPLHAFLGRTFATIDPHQHLLPGRLRAVYPRMRDEGWLSAYGDLSGVRVTLRNMSFRFSRRPDLAPATELLETRREELEARFRSFFPDVQQFARSMRK